MQFRPGRESDFTHVETFVWQAIFPAFDQPGLSDEQRAENDAMVEEARTVVVEALGKEDFGVFVAWDERRRALAGYVIADRSPRAYAIVEQLVVKRTEWGKGVGEQLLELAVDFIGRHRAVQLSVRHFNERAIAFFEKHGFQNTGESAGDQAIPRILMLREAGESVEVEAMPTAELFTTDSGKVSPTPVSAERPASPLEADHRAAAGAESGPSVEAPGIAFSFDFPGMNDEPVFEELPDLNLRAEDPETAPPSAPGNHALAREELPLSPQPLQELADTTLSEEQLTELEAFIARARQAKGLKATPEASPAVSPAADQNRPSGPKAGTPASEPETTEDAGTESVGLHGSSIDEKVAETGVTDEIVTEEVTSDRTAARKAFDPSTIEFEIDYGEGQEVRSTAGREQSGRTETASRSVSGTGAIIVDAVVPEREERTADVQPTPTPAPKTIEIREEPVVPPVATTTCVNCGSTIPTAVRFCPECGHRQIPAPDTESLQPSDQAPASEELTGVTQEATNRPGTTTEDTPEPLPSTEGPEEFEVLELVEEVAAEEPVLTPEQEELEELHSPSTEEAPLAVPSLSDLKGQFREYLYDRVVAYFGTKGATRFLKRYEVDNDFLQLRDGSLTSLRGGLSEGVSETVGQRRVANVIADLTEYFIVEVCQDIHKGLYPQRLLRHQSVRADELDLFRLVMDYLDLDSESEKIYTEFISMPPKVLQRVTTNFLHARPDERIFLICDQSLLSNGKNGFAITDSGLYWKSLLQPAGAVTYTTLSEVRRNGDHLLLDGQFFDAGARLNLKIALLLDRLRRLG